MTSKTTIGPEGQPPFSRPFEVDAPPDYPVDLEIVADESERAALARDLDIPAVIALKGRFHIVKSGGRYDVSGFVEARVTRICVVSLEPFDANLREEVEASYAAAPETRASGRRKGAAPAPREIVVDPEEDAPEPIIDGRMDLGCLAAEFLALGLDPHPRKPGVAFELSSEAVSKPDSPFAILTRLNTPRSGE